MWSIKPITAMSIGDCGRPTLVMALKPSVTSSTRSPTPASTASSATTASPRSEPSRFERLHQQQLAAFVARMLLRGDHFADDARDQHGQCLSRGLRRRLPAGSRPFRHARSRRFRRWWCRWALRPEETESSIPCPCTSRPVRRRPRRCNRCRRCRLPVAFELAASAAARPAGAAVQAPDVFTVAQTQPTTRPKIHGSDPG